MKAVMMSACLALMLAGCTSGGDSRAEDDGRRDRLAAAPQARQGQPNFEMPSPTPTEAGMPAPETVVIARPSGPTCDAGGRIVGPGEEPDWSDFFHFAGRDYLLDEEDSPAAVGEVVGRVRCRLVGSGTPRGYTQRDGDAAYLDVGTKFYRVVGQPVEAVLAVRVGDQIDLYRPESSSG
jgi:hypothetical protein